MRIPQRRDKDFSFNNLFNWHSDGKAVSQFFNSLSPFFPGGERFFIDSVRHYRKNVDPELREAIIGFMGQEAVHGREHRKYNEQLTKEGFNAVAIEVGVERALKKLQIILPPEHQLAITVQLEHITAILAEEILSDPRWVSGEEQASELWAFHALEEFEHKSVAYDVFEQQVDSYLLRTTYLVVQTAVFVAAVYAVLAYAMISQKCTPREIVYLGLFKFGPAGFVWKIIPQWLRWFSPNFHPEN